MLVTAFVALGVSVGWVRCHADHVAEEARGARRLASVEAELAATRSDLEETAAKLGRCGAWLDARLLAARAEDAPRATPPPEEVQAAAQAPVAAPAVSDEPPVAVHPVLARSDAGPGWRRRRFLQVHGMTMDSPDTREPSDRE